MQPVITYAHTNSQLPPVSLCVRHTGPYEAFASLGPVTHGRHYGRCLSCVGQLFAVVRDGEVLETVLGEAGTTWVECMVRQVAGVYGAETAPNLQTVRRFVTVPPGTKVGDRVTIDEDGNAVVESP